MKTLNNNIGKAELLAMIVFTSGCIVDHITTYLLWVVYAND